MTDGQGSVATAESRLIQSGLILLEKEAHVKIDAGGTFQRCTRLECWTGNVPVPLSLVGARVVRVVPLLSKREWFSDHAVVTDSSISACP
jgi:hypothetical protein